LTIPILDTTAAILRRKLTGRSLYISDRGHLHHCLLNRGFSARLVLLWVSLACAVTVGAAVLSAAIKNELVALVSAVAVVTILIGVRVFGHAEYVLARERLLATLSSLVAIRPQTHPRTTEVHIQGSVRWNDVWARFTAQAGELNLHSICLDVNAPFIHEAYHARWDCRAPRAELSSHWFAEMPLMARGQVVGRVEVTGRRDHMPVSAKVAALTQLVEYVERVVKEQKEQPHAKPAAAVGISFAPAPPPPQPQVSLSMGEK
jgi:UDP-GlcNAc:undecaprenyl-phosphate/decaprenyl-phosphate GlcNAc-1-phosphate transferase